MKKAVSGYLEEQGINRALRKTSESSKDALSEFYGNLSSRYSTLFEDIKRTPIEDPIDFSEVADAVDLIKREYVSGSSAQKQFDAIDKLIRSENYMTEAQYLNYKNSLLPKSLQQTSLSKQDIDELRIRNYSHRDVRQILSLKKEITSFVDNFGVDPVTGKQKSFDTQVQGAIKQPSKKLKDILDNEIPGLWEADDKFRKMKGKIKDVYTASAKKLKFEEIPDIADVSAIAKTMYAGDLSPQDYRRLSKIIGEDNFRQAKLRYLDKKFNQIYDEANLDESIANELPKIFLDTINDKQFINSLNATEKANTSYLRGLLNMMNVRPTAVGVVPKQSSTSASMVMKKVSAVLAAGVLGGIGSAAHWTPSAVGQVASNLKSSINFSDLSKLMYDPKLGDLLIDFKKSLSNEVKIEDFLRKTEYISAQMLKRKAKED